MKVSTAIQTLKDRQLSLNESKDHQFFQALSLGIQALDRVFKARLRSPNSILAPLPGETAEMEL